jgi:hypothetical protein
MQYTIVPESKHIKGLLMADRVEICSRESTDKTSVVCECLNIYSCDLLGIFNFISRLLLACLVMSRWMVLDFNQRR